MNVYLFMRVNGPLFKHPRKPRASKGDGKGRERLGARKKGGARGGEGRERGKRKPWEASLHRAFLDQLLFRAVILA